MKLESLFVQSDGNNYGIGGGKKAEDSDLPGFQSNHPLILYLLSHRERIFSSQNYFSDIKKSPHRLQKPDFTGN